MTFKQAKQEFFETLMQQENCLTIEELKARLGTTTIRCYWVDYVDYLCRDSRITAKQQYEWGQVLWNQLIWLKRYYATKIV